MINSTTVMVVIQTALNNTCKCKHLAPERLFVFRLGITMFPGKGKKPRQSPSCMYYGRFVIPCDICIGFYVLNNTCKWKGIIVLQCCQRAWGPLLYALLWIIISKVIKVV